MKRLHSVAVSAVIILLFAVSPQAEEKPEAVLDSIEVLALQTAQSLALAANPDLRAAQARVEQARARVSQAVAAWWPTLDATGFAQHQRLAGITYESMELMASLAGGTADKDKEVFGAGLQATWILFDGFYRKFNKQMAEYGEKSAQAAWVNSQRLLVTSVAEAFYNAQLSQTNVDIAQADEAFYLRQLEDAQNRYDVGAGPWGDVLNIKVQLNSARTSLMRSRREHEAASYGLAALMGLPDALLPAHIRLASLEKDCTLEESVADVDGLIRDALARRSDVRQLEQLVQQAEAGAGMAKAPLYPTVVLAGSVSGDRTEDVGFTDDDFGSSIALKLQWNLFAGGADKARLLEARQAQREAEYTLAHVRTLVASEVRQNIALLEAAKEQVRLQRESVKLVEENRDLAKNEYEAGETSLVRLNEAQRDLTATYGRLAQSVASYHLARQRLQAATGHNLDSMTTRAWLPE